MGEATSAAGEGDSLADNGRPFPVVWLTSLSSAMDDIEYRHPSGMGSAEICPFGVCRMAGSIVDDDI